MEVLLMTAASILLIFIIFFIFKKIIALTFVRFLYGHYSHEFATRYRKYYIRSPFQYCFRDELISHLLYLNSDKTNLPVVLTTKDIYFENIPYFTDYKEFLTKKGAPYCFNSFEFKNPGFIVKAIGYQERIVGSKATLVFYFLDDAFFMGEYVFKDPKTDIKGSLLSHFAGEKVLEEDQFIIKDHLNRMVHFRDTGFTIDIKYLSTEDEELTGKLMQYLTRLTSREKIVPEP